MVGQIDFKIQGLRKAERLLRELGPEIATKIGDQAVRNGAKPIVESAKANAPRETGNLQRAISIKVLRKRGDNARVALVGVRSMKVPDPRTETGLGNPAMYAHLVELGTVHTAARPFLRPALDSNHNRILNAMVTTFQRGIKREAKKLSKKINVRD